MENAHLINSIYRATEGEGLFVGRPQIFVRYQGCHVGCLNCDSKDTWDFDQKTKKTLSEVLNEIKKEGFEGKIKTVSITGGDPLHPSHVPSVLELVKALKSAGHYVNIEAAGTRVVEEIFQLVDFISFDLKTPSTGVKIPLQNFKRLTEQFADKSQIKAVIFGQEDFDYTYKYLLELKTFYPNFKIPWVLTPCYNTEEAFPMERFQKILSMNEASGGHFRVIGQQHKWVFGPDKKQV